jgi:hypothetical protein
VKGTRNKDKGSRNKKQGSRITANFELLVGGMDKLVCPWAETSMIKD